MAGGDLRIIRLSETGSTNKDAMRLVLAGEPLPLWVTALRQTQGRGRAGRMWLSQPGNLHASVAFASNVAPERAGQLSLVAGVTLFDAIAATTLLSRTNALRLKWPNDILIDGAKAGGILVESAIATGIARRIAVIGFGLNVMSAPPLDRPVTSLRDHGAVIDGEIILAELAERLQTWLEIWNEGEGFDIVRTHWLAHGGYLGEPITVTVGPQSVSGTYQGLTAEGALIACIEGKTETFNFGDVALVAGGEAPPDQ